MKKVLGLMAVIAVTGCTKNHESCVLEDTGAKVGAVVISNVLGCKGVTAIEADAKEQIAKLNLCGKAGLANKSGGICEAVGNMILDGAISKIPTDWQCDGGMTVDMARSLLVAKCSGSPI